MLSPDSDEQDVVPTGSRGTVAFSSGEPDDLDAALEGFTEALARLDELDAEDAADDSGQSVNDGSAFTAVTV